MKIDDYLRRIANIWLIVGCVAIVLSAAMFVLSFILGEPVYQRGTDGLLSSGEALVGPVLVGFGGVFFATLGWFLKRKLK